MWFDTMAASQANTVLAIVANDGDILEQLQT